MLNPLQVALQGLFPLTPIAVAVQGLIGELEEEQKKKFAAEIDITPRRWYVKRGKRLYLFNTGEEADAFIEAQEAIEKAQQKTSRRARKRARAKVQTPTPVDVLDTGYLVDFASVTLPDLMPQMATGDLLDMVQRALEMQEEDDLEMLLLA